MAKGAANEAALGGLHLRITEVFIKVLQTYEARMIAVENIDPSELESEVLEQLFSENAMPNPAMLSAVTKFLKDNNVTFDTEKLAELSDQERRLKERREKRGNIVSLTSLHAVGE